MSLILKRTEIMAFFTEQELADGTEKIIWANLGGVQGPYVVLVFNQSGILTLPITATGKIEGEIILLEPTAIKAVHFKKGLMAYKLVIETSDGSDVPPFRVNKLIIGYSEQKRS